MERHLGQSSFFHFNQFVLFCILEKKLVWKFNVSIQHNHDHAKTGKKQKLKKLRSISLIENLYKKGMAIKTIQIWKQVF